MKKLYVLDEPHEFVGVWNVPSDPDNTIPGVLKYDPESGISLFLEGQFKNHELTVVHGNASGCNITLLDCFSTSWSVSFNSSHIYSPSKLIVNKVIVGVHLDNLNTLEVKEAYIETSDIKPWSNISGFDGKAYRESIDSNGFTLSFRTPEAVLIYSDSRSKIELFDRLTFPSGFPYNEEMTFRETNYFRVSNAGGVSGLLYDEHLDAIRKFISLASRTEVDCRSIKLHIDSYDMKVHVLCNLVPISLDYKSSNYNRHHMFFDLPFVKDRIADLYGAWFNYYKKSPESVNLYFYKSKGWLHDIFLSKSQAIEEAHRQLNTGTNKWEFRRRVCDLFEQFYDIMKFTGNKNAFAQLVKDHRDYYSHWFEKKREKVFTGLELSYLSRDINLLLEMTLLRAMGFSVGEIADMIRGCFDYRSYLDLSLDQKTARATRRLQWREEVHDETDM